MEEMKAIPPDRLRIIDANLNRIGEGLRVLEEFARLAMNDAALSQRLKDLRHRLLVTDSGLRARLLGARDAAGDVGAALEAPDQGEPRDAVAVITANARRVQESLRVLEEIARTPASGLDTNNFKEARFAVYTLEKDLLSRLLRRDERQRIRGLYVIIDPVFLLGRSPVDAAAAAIKGGASIIQLRDKERGKRELLGIAGKIKHLCKEAGVLFIVNDSLDIALAVDADGLHVGAEDLPPAEARRLLPLDKLLGCSARTVDDAVMADADGVDYLGVGSMYATSSKSSATVVGPGRIEEIKREVDLPVVAIGGIKPDNLGEVMQAGADAAAVISAVLGAADIEKATRQLVKIIEGEKGG